MSITSQRSVLVCMSCPLRGSRSRILTSTRPPVALRPSITWHKGRREGQRYRHSLLISLVRSGVVLRPLTSTISLISLCDSSFSSFTRAVPIGLSLRKKPLWDDRRHHSIHARKQQTWLNVDVPQTVCDSPLVQQLQLEAFRRHHPPEAAVVTVDWQREALVIFWRQEMNLHEPQIQFDFCLPGNLKS